MSSGGADTPSDVIQQDHRGGRGIRAVDSFAFGCSRAVSADPSNHAVVASHWTCSLVRLRLLMPTALPLPPHRAHQVALEGAQRFPPGLPLSLASRQIGLGGGITA